MHSLRILKKLSKRAAPLLPLLGDDRKQFRAERGDNYMGSLIKGRKHWERGRSVNPDLHSEREIKTPRRRGPGWVWAKPPCHPRKGTVMVGATTGYFEPEWDEETAWEALEGLVLDSMMEFTDDGELVLPTPFRSTPSQIFAAAERLLTVKVVRQPDV